MPVPSSLVCWANKDIEIVFSIVIEPNDTPSIHELLKGKRKKRKKIKNDEVLFYLVFFGVISSIERIIENMPYII